MRGESHYGISVVVVLPTIVFLWKLNPSVESFRSLMWAVGGVMLGSLLADVDAPDSKIMYWPWKPLGCLGRCISKPLRTLFGWEHRGIVHSLFGCLYISSIFVLFSFVLELVGVFFIWYFWIGIPIGFLLHLAEDSFTPSGVKWLYPRDEKIRGAILNGSEGEYFLGGISLIVYGSWTVFGYFVLPASMVAFLLIVGVTFAILGILHRMSPRIGDMGEKRYSLERKVEFYVEDMGGKKIKPREPSGPVLQTESEEEYVVQIFGLDYEWSLDRGPFRSVAEVSSLEEGDVTEFRTYEGKKEKRVYYIVQSGEFYAYLRWTKREPTKACL